MPLSQKNTFQPKMNVKGSTFLNLLNEIADVCFNVKHMVGYTDSGIVIDHPEQLLSPENELFRVTVATDGGTAGNSTTQCSFTYAAASLGSEDLGSALTPTKARPPLGAMVVGSDIGWGYYDGSDFVLWDANEVIDTEACA